jgi:hypothetical protein
MAKNDGSLKPPISVFSFSSEERSIANRHAVRIVGNPCGAVTAHMGIMGYDLQEVIVTLIHCGCATWIRETTSEG